MSAAVREAGVGPPPEGESRWTAYVGWNPEHEGDFPRLTYGCVEEIDLDAAAGTPLAEVRAEVERVLAETYEPGGTVFALEERFGWYL